ncbi:MAG: TatD family hydrolase [Propionibacteriaceae bacterium]|jgi:TatD DNase family protein|nr:TatD family hydrolase [Propionibacteriaceae bacterium]
MAEYQDVGEISARLAELSLPPLPAPLDAAVIDSHTHLDATLEVSGLPVELSLAAAAAVGVTRMVQIGCDVPSSRWAVEVARAYPQVVACVAIHPNDAGRLSDTALDAALDEIAALAAAQPYVRGVGETGIDYYRTRELAAQERQRRSFAAHIRIAIAHDLTLAIHDRDAHADILKVWDATGAPNRVVMHCFSGDVAFAQECLARGAWLSFPGVITYKANQYLRDVLAITPRERILVETDAPYLTPVPERGKRNAPYLIPHTLRFMADELGLAEAELCALLTENAVAAYGGEWGETLPRYTAAEPAAPLRGEQGEQGGQREQRGQGVKVANPEGISSYGGIR